MHDTLLELQTQKKSYEPIISRKVFVGCIPGDAEESKLVNFFKSQGNVEHVKLKYKTQLVNAGYCIVSCGDEATYQRLLNEDIIFQRRKLECRPFMEHSQLQKFRKTYNQRRVYVYNISSRTSDRDIKALFEHNVGPVENAYCIRKLRKRKGQIFGYVLFKTLEDSEKAVKLGQLNLRGQMIKIKKFIDREEQIKGRPSGGRPHQLNYKPGMKDQRFMPATAHNSWNNLERAQPQNFHQAPQANQFPTRFERQNNKHYYANYDHEQQIPFHQLNGGLYPTDNSFNNNHFPHHHQVKQKLDAPPSFESRPKKPASRIVFELQKAVWRNHSKNNLRYNCSPKQQQW